MTKKAVAPNAYTHGDAQERFGYAPIGLAIASALGVCLEKPATVTEIHNATKSDRPVYYSTVYAAVLRAEQTGLVARGLDGMRYTYVATKSGRAAFYAHKAAVREWQKRTK